LNTIINDFEVFVGKKSALKILLELTLNIYINRILLFKDTFFFIII
jgi:hypothetical protein